MSFLRSIMFVGTCSDAGKSIVNTAFCRIFKQDGYHPAPFKAQNMSLNSYSTPDGLEIGRAQAVQAEACGITPESDMNPVLLKPTNEQCSQVVLNGKPVGNMSAREYFMSNNKAELFNQAYAAYERLQARYSPIVLEGAGSISEINLRERDITNMRMALRTNAATYLVADIDRGGVFASVYGSITLLSEEERKYFTLVLKSMLTLANAKFLFGCRGSNLDILAREPLWEDGVDYRCGTGHGVGYFLGVHEGPNAFRWRSNPENLDAVLQPGMVITDEPGVYVPGKYGIRTENMLICKKWQQNEYGAFLHFEPLTLVPIDLDGVDLSLFNEKEKQLLADYQQFVYDTLSPHLNEEESAWLHTLTL